MVENRQNFHAEEFQKIDTPLSREWIVTPTPYRKCRMYIVTFLQRRQCGKGEKRVTSQ